MKSIHFLRNWVWLLTLIVALVFFIPVLWMIITSVKPNNEIFSLPPTFLPHKIVWANYPQALLSAPFGRYVINSLVVSTSAVVVSLVSSSLAGYSHLRAFITEVANCSL